MIVAVARWLAALYSRRTVLEIWAEGGKKYRPKAARNIGDWHETHSYADVNIRVFV
jgi:hypothetical protein